MLRLGDLRQIVANADKLQMSDDMEVALDMGENELKELENSLIFRDRPDSTGEVLVFTLK